MARAEELKRGIPSGCSLAKVPLFHSIAAIKRVRRQLEILLGGASGGGPDGVLQNVLWLLFDRGWRLLIGFAVGVAVARHLGPEGSGMLMSTMALAALCGCMVELGFDAILRRELANASMLRRNELLGTATALRVVFLPVAITVFATIFFLDPPRAGVFQIFTAFALTIPLPIALILDSWFQSQTRARYTVWAQNAALLVSASVRLFLLAQKADVTAFAWVAAGEAFVTATLLALLYGSSGQHLSRWRVSASTARALWRDAWPFAVINLAALGYTRLDMVMLGALRSEAEAGYFGVATRLTEMGFIIPMILINTLLPTLARLRADSRADYRDRVQHLCTLVTWLGIVTALVFSVSAPWLVPFLYGSAFAPAAPVLSILVWTVVFASQSAARGQWLLLENLQRFGLWYVLIGILVNVLLNVALIPPWGATGAAIAAVATQAVVAFVGPALFAPTRPGVRFLLDAFLLRRKAAPTR